MSRILSAEDQFKEHYLLLREYLSPYLQTLGQSQRGKTSAKDKLSKLPQEEFVKVSTDVYDEIKRRMYDSKNVPFLPIRSDLLPKRNQARQKMATLSLMRFQELSSEVMFEIEKRFPKLADEPDQKNIPPSSQDAYYQNNDKSFPRGTRGKSSDRRHDDRPRERDRKPSNASSVTTSSANRNSHEIEKLRSEYEFKIARLEQQLRDSDKQLRESDKIINDLEKKVDSQSQLSSELQNKNSDLQNKYESLKEDYSHQKDITDSLRAEAANLLTEIKTLSAKNKELELKLQRTSFDAQSDRHSGRGSSNSQRLAAYYESIDELSDAARNGQSTAVLVAMKAVLLSCKSITEESESIENAGILNESDKVRLHSGKEALSSALSHLLEIAKDHASGGVSLNGLDDAIDRLTQSMNDLVNIMKRYEKRSMKDAPISKWASPPDSPSKMSSAPRDSNIRGMDLVELKLFLEEETDEIAHTIQDLLESMRSSSTSGHELEKFIHVITDHIDVVIFESKGTFNQHGQRDLAEEALDLLSSLSDTKNVLDSLGKKIANDSSNKSVKQKIANTSYEIAKYAKDLLSLLE